MYGKGKVVAEIPPKIERKWVGKKWRGKIIFNRIKVISRENEKIQYK